MLGGVSRDEYLNLYERGRSRLTLVRDRGGVSGHGAFADFADAEERDAAIESTG